MTPQPRNIDVTRALEQAVPLSLQEGYDNCGWQVGRPEAPCTGVLVCVDPTEERVKEAAERGCSLIVSHHPLLFHGLKRITGASVPERAVMAAIEAGVGVYSLHTALDNAPAPLGVSLRMARMMGLEETAPLVPSTGSGAIGTLPAPLTPEQAVALVKSTFGAPVVRVSRHDPRRLISRVALCGGSGSSLLPQAVEAGAQMMVTADTGHHRFVDFGPSILIADISHFDSELCTKQLIHEIISEKFANFAVVFSQEINPITYL